MQSYELGDPILQLIKDNIETFGISEHAFTLLTNSLIKLILKKPNEPDLGGSNPHPPIFDQICRKNKSSPSQIANGELPRRLQRRRKGRTSNCTNPNSIRQISASRTYTSPHPSLPFPSLSLLFPYNPHLCSIRIKIGGSG